MKTFSINIDECFEAQEIPKVPTNWVIHNTLTDRRFFGAIHEQDVFGDGKNYFFRCGSDDNFSLPLIQYSEPSNVQTFWIDPTSIETISSNNTLSCIATDGNGLYVAAGTARPSSTSYPYFLYTNDPSDTWSAVDFPDMPSGVNGRADMVYGDGVFVSVGNGTKPVAISSDGQNWTGYSIPGATATRVLLSVVYTGSEFYAVGVNSTAKESIMYKSTDGTSWSSVSIPQFGTSSSELRTIHYHNGKYVAGGRGFNPGEPTIGDYTYRNILISNDGTNWTVVETEGIAGLVYLVGFADGRWHAFGGNSKQNSSYPGIIVSTDNGATWEEDSNILTGIAPSGGGFRAPGRKLVFADNMTVVPVYFGVLRRDAWYSV